MAGWMMAALIGVGSFVAGVALALVALRMQAPQAPAREEPAPAPPEPGVPPPRLESEVSGATPPRAAHLLGLIARDLRGPLALLRREAASPPGGVVEIERIAWRARMLASRPRPMQAQPSSAISLLQEAAQEVELLRLGKVTAAWTLLTRQPVHVDAERTRAAFRELLTTCAETVGEGGRIAVRIHAGEHTGYPVSIEMEIGRGGAEADALPSLVARHLLESQGARVSTDGPVTRVELRSLPAGGPEERG